MKLKLHNGDRVCIAGGGPAGSFAAIHLLRFAEEKKLELEVIIFDYRRGEDRGPAGCKGCAGILSSTLIKNLKSIGVEIPGNIILDELKSYMLYMPYTGKDAVVINQPDPSRKIYSISRGGGPRMLPGQPVQSFDNFLRSEAVRRGAKVIRTMIRKIIMDDRPVIVADSGTCSADLLVLATGVNSFNVMDPCFRYSSPGTAVMMQDEFMKPAAFPDDTVAAFFDEPEYIFFGTMVPKGDYVNVSLFSKNPGKVRSGAVKNFFKTEAAGTGKLFTTHFENLCGCMPRIAVTAAKRYSGDRWVAVGDAAVTRLYKDGIGSAYITSEAAMKTAVMYGIEERDFNRTCGKIYNAIRRDNFAGKIMFRILSLIVENRTMAGAVYRCIRDEHRLRPAGGVFSQVIWGILTGDYSYRFLFVRMFSISGIYRFLKNLICRCVDKS